ncbi:MAG: BACON domain-containing protein [Bacteroides xylanisolvens]
MKTIKNLSFLLATCLLLCLSACHEQEDYGEDIQDGKLVLNYQVDGGMEVPTYAVAAQAHECRIDDVYTLFFRSPTHSDPNKYVGYSRTAVDAVTSTGSVRVTLPDGEKADDEWQLLFLANFDANAFLDGAGSIDDLLTNKMAGKTYEAACKYLKAFFTQTTGMGAPLAMSAQAAKAASTNAVGINFKRRVARIDVKNSAVSNFKLETVQVWNARSHGYMFDEGGFNTDSICHYKDQDVKAVNEKVEAKLYAFPNFVETPEDIEDKFTTCLIIGGKYNNSSTITYYRVNVCPAASQQLLKANSIYTINITKVNSAGESSKEDAYKSPIEVEYEINEWDDSFLGIYVFDEDGNGLGVSQRKVIFSEEGNQLVELEVFTLKSATKPLSGNWAVSELQGTSASTYFSAKRNSVAADEKCLTVTTLIDNATLYDREATFDVTWGNISIPINLTQLNPNSLISKISLLPDELEFEKPGGTQEICVNLQGNFGGIDRGNITPVVLYQGSESDWLTLGPGTTPDSPALGLFYFNVTASENISGVDRLADIKFVVTQGDLIATAQASVKQNSVVVREVSIHLFEKSGTDYEDRGLASEYFSEVKGLSPGQGASNHLHFPILTPDQFKYQMRIKSSVDWEVSSMIGASSNLQLSPSSGTGDAYTESIVEITVTSQADSGWDGGFYIKYEDGDQTEFIVHQQGAFKKLGEYTNESDVIAESNHIYYYGVFKMNGKLWLDRNLGATVGQDGINGYFTNESGTGIPSVLAAKGVYFARAQANKACPPGFRLPKGKAGNGDGEWEWVFSEMKWSGLNGNAAGGVAYKKVWYVTYSENPLKRWFMPVGGSSLAPQSKQTNYWSLGYSFFYYFAGEERYGLGNSEYKLGYTVRCVQDS